MVVNKIYSNGLLYILDNKEQTEEFIKLRRDNENLFTGAQNSATVVWRYSNSVQFVICYAEECRGTPHNKDSRKWKEITAAIATYICKDMIPFYTVEKRVSCISKNTRLQVHNAHPKTHELPRLYYECWAKVEEEVHNFAYYAATMDMWTRHTMHPYMSRTVHFIRDWTLFS